MNFHEVEQLKPLLNDQFCQGLNTILKTYSLLLSPDDGDDVLKGPFEGYSPFHVSTDVDNGQILPEAVSHVSRLPTETLVEIFQLYVEDTFDIERWSKNWMQAKQSWGFTDSELEGARHCEIGQWPSALVLSQVCHEWHNIVVDIPYLWSFLYVEVGEDDMDIFRLLNYSFSELSSSSLLETLLSLEQKMKKRVGKMARPLRRLIEALVRSEKLPLHVCLLINFSETDYYGREITDPFPILHLLMAVSPRWKELYVDIPANVARSFRIDDRVPLLETVMWRTDSSWSPKWSLHGPAIRKVVLCNQQPFALPASVTSLICTASPEHSSTTIASLSRFPSLYHVQHLSLTQVDLYARGDFRPIPFDSLRSLSLVTKVPSSQRSKVRLCSVPTFLDDFVTPQLEKLSLDGLYGVGNNIREMLVRSGCFLRELEIRGGLMMTPRDLEDLFVRVTPGLWKLKMLDCEEVDDGLVKSMTPGPPHTIIPCVLPELIDFQCETISFDEEIVRGFVESRWKVGDKGGTEGKFNNDSCGAGYIRRPQVVALEVFNIPGRKTFNPWEQVLMKEGLHITIKRKEHTPFSFAFNLKKGH